MTTGLTHKQLDKQEVTEDVITAPYSSKFPWS